MSNITRSKIRKPLDIVKGCGLSVKTKSVAVDMVGIENYYRVNPDVSYGTAVAIIDVVFDFEAGYSISAQYNASAHKEAEIKSIKDAISLVESENLAIGIRLDQTYDIEFNNWSLKAENREIFEEILNSTDEWHGCDLSGEKTQSPVIFTQDDDCAAVAYGLLRSINGDNPKYPSTGFTKEMVTDLQAQIKKTIIEAFTAQAQRQLID